MLTLTQSVPGVTTAGLQLNPTKTKLMLLSRKHSPPAVSITVHSTPILKVDSFKYFGATITSNLQ